MLESPRGRFKDSESESADSSTITDLAHRVADSTSSMVVFSNAVSSVELDNDPCPSDSKASPNPDGSSTSNPRACCFSTYYLIRSAVTSAFVFRLRVIGARNSAVSPVKT